MGALFIVLLNLRLKLSLLGIVEAQLDCLDNQLLQSLSIIIVLLRKISRSDDGDDFTNTGSNELGVFVNIFYNLLLVWLSLLQILLVALNARRVVLKIN